MPRPRAGARRPEPFFGRAVNILRILAFSTFATGLGAIQASILYTERKFAPAAFSQAILNSTGTILTAAWTLWKPLGVYAFPQTGYAVGAWAQLGIVSWFARGKASISDSGRGQRRSRGANC